MKTLAEIINLEEAFEKNSVAEFNAQVACEKWRSCFELNFQSQWTSFVLQAKELFNEEDSSLARIFLLHKMIAACEERYDLHLREKLLRLWSEIKDPFESFYGEFWFHYQKATFHFFSGALKQAQSSFLISYNIAARNKWDLGKAKAQYHLALIDKDLKLFHSAELKFQELRGISELRGFTRLLAKVNRNHSSWDVIKNEFLEHLAKRQFLQARKILAEMEIKRRREKKLKNRESLGAYLALYFSLTGRYRSGGELFFKCEDAIVKRNLLFFKQKHFGLNREELFWLKSLEAEHFSAAHALIMAELPRIRAPHVSGLLQLFLESSEVVSKQEICEKVWNYSYNPLTHDNKIYKIMNELRKTLPADIILNTYGGYRLNIEWAGLQPN